MDVLGDEDTRTCAQAFLALLELLQKAEVSRNGGRHFGYSLCQCDQFRSSDNTKVTEWFVRIGGSEGGAFASGPPLLNRRLVTCDTTLIGDAWHLEMPRRGLLTAQLIHETSRNNRPLQSSNLHENWPEASLTLESYETDQLISLWSGEY